MERKLRLKLQGHDTLLDYWDRFDIIWIMVTSTKGLLIVHLTRVPLATFWKRIGPQNKLRCGGVEVAGWTVDRTIRVRFPAYPVILTACGPSGKRPGGRVATVGVGWALKRQLVPMAFGARQHV